jgi:hypothetical protein
MSISWEEPTPQEVEWIVSTLDPGNDFVLADSEPWSDKAKRENRQIGAMFAVVLVCGAVILAWLFNWIVWSWR